MVDREGGAFMEVDREVVGRPTLRYCVASMARSWLDFGGVSWCDRARRRVE